ncbi:DNA/RNA helicase domain-containing protein [Streptomyces sp. NPDC013740]|uniref:DNA/RNA helicase domain-containing protein n=1 Tax=Streptomyces sp. NPDC013740 TaxID=3364867 RepID=UPI0036F528AB
MLFHAPAYEVAAQAHEGSLSAEALKRITDSYGHELGASQVALWERSIAALVGVLMDAGLDQVEMIMEYELPLTSKRADVILAGVHPDSGDPSYIVIEVKQWSNAEPVEGEPTLCRVPPYPQPVLNPVEQARRYSDYLASTLEALAGHPERITGAAYLYNATDFDSADLHRGERGAQGSLFTADSRREFISFLRERLARHSGEAAANELLTGRTRPAKRLMDIAAAEVRDREQLVLLDEQRVAYDEVLYAVHRAQRSDRKTVVIVTGGPGSGKSAIALALLGEFHRRGLTALHATGSASFTKSVRKLAGAGSRETQKLFTYFNTFISAEPNSVDVLICDEAHRLRQTSANRYTRASLRTGKAQVEELIDAARVSVFLLDEFQTVRPGEVGTVDLIRAAAEAKGIDCRIISLQGHFRSGGSDAYLRWVAQLLDPPEGGPTAWEPDGRMDVRVADSPQELEAFLDTRRAQGYTARITAGYCWKWTTKVHPGEKLPADVVIGDWARPWTVFGERAVGGAPPAPLWAIDPAGFGQVGSVYTAQGFEYDWNGVIIGPDLIWRSDRWVTDRTASKDPVFKTSTPDADVDRLIRNTYKVLLTRGLVGTLIYSTDAETREKLRALTGTGSRTTAEIK